MVAIFLFDPVQSTQLATVNKISSLPEIIFLLSERWLHGKNQVIVTGCSKQDATTSWLSTTLNNIVEPESTRNQMYQC